MDIKQAASIVTEDAFSITLHQKDGDMVVLSEERFKEMREALKVLYAVVVRSGDDIGIRTAYEKRRGAITAKILAIKHWLLTGEQLP